MTTPARYSRNLHSLSDEECQALAAKHVAVLGCGGLGGYFIEELARLGVGHLRLVDGDVFEETNLNRQILATHFTLGMSKAQAAAQRVHAVNDLVHAEAIDALVTEANAAQLVSGVDCAIDCLDNFESRFVLAHACQRAGIPLVYGAIAGWFGQACTVLPGDISFVEVYGSTSEGEKSQHLKLGNLPFTAAVTASVMAAEAAKVLLGRGELIRNRLAMIDLLDGSFDELPFAH